VTAAPAVGAAAVYTVRVNGRSYTVEVAEGGELTSVAPAAEPVQKARRAGDTDAVKAVLAGNIFKVHVAVGDTVEQGQPLLVVEAMKMETAVAAPRAGTVTDVFVSEGDAVAVGDALVAID
jgi:oxaloacetate decarboxylase alpha subunit